MPTSAAIYSYLGVFMSLLATGLGFPIPEEIPVVAAGIMAGNGDGDVHWWIMLPTCILGVVFGDGALYIIGRYGGRRLLNIRWLREKLLPPDRLAEIEGNFHKYGVKILLFARLLPGIRSPIFIAAGIMRVPVAKFLLADGIYAIPGVSLLFWLSYFARDRFQKIVEEVESYRHYVIAACIILAATYLLYRFWKRPVSTGGPSDLSLVGGTHTTVRTDPTPEPVSVPEIKI